MSTSGARAPSMADVAAYAGVSHQTVSRVLNGSELVRGATRDRVLEAIDSLGYRRNNAARALATNRSGRIGLVVGHLGLHGPSSIAAGVHRAALAAGYDLSLAALESFTREGLDGAINRLLDEAVEAVIVAVNHRVAHETAASIRLSVPVVLAQGVNRGEPMAAGVDQAAGARMATRHLLSQGHSNVLFVGGPPDWIEARQRRSGWMAALRRAGVSGRREIQGDWSPQSGYDAGRQIAADPSVTAVFAANDSMALGVLKALHESGRAVPDDVSVVGFDDSPEAEFFWPALTSVRQDFGRLGATAVELVLRTLAGEHDATADLVPPELVIRTSSTHPRSSNA